MGCSMLVTILSSINSEGVGNILESLQHGVSVTGDSALESLQFEVSIIGLSALESLCFLALQ